MCELSRVSCPAAAVILTASEAGGAADPDEEWEFFQINKQVTTWLLT